MTKVGIASLSFVLCISALGSAQVVDELTRRRAFEHYRAGQEFLTSERYDRAAEEFTAAIQLDPLLTLAHYGLGQSYMALKRYASAIQAYIGGRAAYERIADLRQRDEAEGNRLQADEINELRDSMRRVQSGQVVVNAGTAHRIQQRLEELETMRRGKNFGPAFRVPAELSLALGSAYYRNGQVQEAEREWLAAVSVNSKLGEAHNNLAALYMMSGRKQQAEEAVKAAERARFRVNPQLKEDIRRMK
jgi:tetratricopeptide (TPR) repeat protein